MAVTGLALFLFVVGHMVGNLQVFLGPEALNAYGEFLHSKPALLWSVRVGLLVIVGAHIAAAVALARENKAARPVAYVDPTPPLAASYASRTMLMSGCIIVAFVVYHLLHFTVQVEAINLVRGTDFKTMVDAQGRHDVFGMVIAGFSQPIVSLFYLVAMALLCLHLSHGLSAMFQSVGCHPCCPGWLDRFALVAAGLIFMGYASIPVAILVFGYGKGGPP